MEESELPINLTYHYMGLCKYISPELAIPSRDDVWKTNISVPCSSKENTPRALFCTLPFECRSMIWTTYITATLKCAHRDQFAQSMCVLKRSMRVSRSFKADINSALKQTLKNSIIGTRPHRKSFAEDVGPEESTALFKFIHRVNDFNNNAETVITSAFAPLHSDVHVCTVSYPISMSEWAMTVDQKMRTVKLFRFIVTFITCYRDGNEVSVRQITTGLDAIHKCIV